MKPHLSPEMRGRLLKLLALQSTSFDGERNNATQAVLRLLAQHGLEWGDVIVEAASAVTDWRLTAEQILATNCCTSWERDFLTKLLRSWRGPCLTAKQQAVLDRMRAAYCRVAA